jgi:hypothetical protein
MSSVVAGDPTVSPGPAMLYHYTDAPGLHGILSNLELWASDCRFLNDTTELDYAREVIVSAMRAVPNPALRAGHPQHANADDFGRQFKHYKDSLKMNVRQSSAFVACFCEQNDLLSQWRGYGSDHGYCIGFRRSALEQAAERFLNTDPVPCVRRVEYGPTPTQRALGAALDRVEADSDLAHPGSKGYALARFLTPLVAAIKNPAFSEEREWRFICPFRGEVPGEKLRYPIEFRPSGVAIVPYVAVGFEPHAITSITVGPGSNSELRKIGVRTFLSELGIRADIVDSEVPYRW